MQGENVRPWRRETSTSFLTRRREHWEYLPVYFVRGVVDSCPVVALAVAALQEQFGSQASRCATEVDMDVSESGSGNKVRRADALVEFD